jgi:hypothetical protein
MQRIIFLVVVIAFSALIFSCSDDAQLPMATAESEDFDGLIEDSDSELSLEKRNTVAEFELTLENLTPATGPGASQPLSPPVLAVHNSRFRIFKEHRYASDELLQIAEDAVNGPMIDLLSNSTKVFDFAEGEGVILPGASASFTLKAKRGFSKLSLVCMLVNTNDAFAGISRARLPRHGKRIYYLYAYDAGTEKNTELTDHIPGPCCGNPLVRVPTHKKIKKHRGIQGIGDLDPAVYDWNRKVAKLTIRRIN